MPIVFDSSAVLAFLGNEPGSDAFAERLPGGMISAVNLAEVASKLSDRGIDNGVVPAILSNLGLRVMPFDETAAYAVSALRQLTRSAGLSLGDRACLALGQILGCPVITGDRSWAGLDVGIEIRLIR